MQTPKRHSLTSTGVGSSLSESLSFFNNIRLNCVTTFLGLTFSLTLFYRRDRQPIAHRAGFFVVASDTCGGQTHRVTNQVLHYSYNLYKHLAWQGTGMISFSPRNEAERTSIDWKTKIMTWASLHPTGLT